MLERSQLWLANLPTPAESARLATAPAGEPLGFARWHSGANFLAAAVLAVHEHDEEPLLFSVRRSWTWWRRYGVTDADDRLVGYTQTDALLTPAARAIVWRIPSAGEIRYHIVGGPLLATARAEGSGVGLRFHTGAGTENPFLRMLVLAAVLVG